MPNSRLFAPVSPCSAPKSVPNTISSKCGRLGGRPEVELRFLDRVASSEVVYGYPLIGGRVGDQRREPGAGGIVPPAGAAWLRCRTHYTTNLMAITPKSSWPWVRTPLHSIFDRPGTKFVVAQYDRVLDGLSDRYPKWLSTRALRAPSCSRLRLP